MFMFCAVFPKSKLNQTYKEDWKYLAADSTEINYYCTYI